jgi:glyoxylase-like metal-dependent hydrolase (beta-lactamase superfamily II)
MRRQERLTRLIVLSVAIIAATAGSGSAQAADKARARAAPPAATQPPPELQLLAVQGKVYMLAGTATNVAVQIGDDGVLLVDTPIAALVPAAAAAIRTQSPRPIRYVITTALDAERVSGQQAVGALGQPLPGTEFFNSGAGLVAAAGGNGGVTILAHENVLSRLTSEPKGGALAGAVVTSEYYLPSKDFFMNDEPIIVYHAPAAHTDGDSFVFFRRSDVLVTGDLFTPGQYPRIDLSRGGSVTGLLDALNRLLEIAVPGNFQERGTYVIPGRGRICDEADLVEFRDMIRIVADRVQDLISQGKTLEQVRATRPTRDYDTEYLSEKDSPTSDQFVEAVYRGLAGGEQHGVER